MTLSLLIAITDLGDSAVVIALAMLTAAHLAWLGYRRAAWTLVLVLIAAAGTIGLLKVVFVGCGAELFSLRVHSPSGHVAMSVAVYGILAGLFARSLNGWFRAIPIMLSIALAGAIAVSRIVLGMHSIDEVIVGIAVGIAVAGAGFALLAATKAQPIRMGRLLALLVVVAVVMDGMRLPAEDLVRYLASLAHQNVPYCATMDATGWPIRRL